MSNGKGGPQASNLGQMVRGDYKHRIWANGKGGPQGLNLGQMVRGDHRHEIWIKW